MTCGCVCCVGGGACPPGVVGVFLLRAGGLVFLETLVFLKELVFLWCTKLPLSREHRARSFCAMAADGGLLQGFISFGGSSRVLCQRWLTLDGLYVDSGTRPSVSAG